MKDQDGDRASERAERISAEYALKLAMGRVAGRSDGNIEAQAANYASAQVMMSRLRAETAAVLDKHGVPMIVRPFYYSFALKLARRDRQLLNEAHKRAEARVQVQLWAGRGLKRDVMMAVAREVLNMDLDAPDPAPCTRPG
jgi:hypothetical protein